MLAALQPWILTDRQDLARSSVLANVNHTCCDIIHHSGPLFADPTIPGLFGQEANCLVGHVVGPGGDNVDGLEAQTVGLEDNTKQLYHNCIINRHGTSGTTKFVGPSAISKKCSHIYVPSMPSVLCFPLFLSCIMPHQPSGPLELT